MYYTHDNGERPFLVKINSNVVSVFTEENKHSNKPDLIITGKKIWIPSDRYSDGNTILVELKDLSYCWIGSDVRVFRASSKIVDYQSPIGNSDVPYPYAKDSEGRFYLIIEDVVITPKKPNNHSDPYMYYYDSFKIPKGFQNINKFYIGDNPVELSYTPKPDQVFDRLRKHEYDSDSQEEITLFVKKKIKGKLTRKKFTKLMNDFGKEMDFEPLDITSVVCKRFDNKFITSSLE